jgi:hypothetical protein
MPLRTKALRKAIAVSHAIGAASSFDQLNIIRLELSRSRSTRSLVETHALALLQLVDVLGALLNMNKDVDAAGIGHDEAKAAISVEHFNSASRH